MRTLDRPQPQFSWPDEIELPLQEVDFVKFAEVENATRPLKDLAIEVDQTLDAYYDMQLGSSPDWNELERKLEQLVFNEKKARNIRKSGN